MKGRMHNRNHTGLEVARRFLCASWSLLFSVLATAFSSCAQTNIEPLSVWDVSTRATVGGGYRENILLSSINPKGSSFIETTADFSVMRLSDSGASLTLFALGEWRRYLDAKEYRNEAIAYVVAGGGWPVGIRDTVVTEFQYFYQHQVLDVSETEANLRRALVLGHGFSLQPSWKHELSDAWSVQLKGAAQRQLYDGEELDNYWEGLVRLGLTYDYGHRSLLRLAYELRQRFYDQRRQYSSSGAPVAGTHLVYRYDEVGGEWRHYWDADRNWRATLKVGYLWNADNGSGYFNYDRVQVSAAVRWHQEKWDVRLQGRGGWYEYPEQTVGGEERVRSYYALDIRAERQLDEHWLVYAAASREWNLSNDALDEYNDWLASGGIGVQF